MQMMQEYFVKHNISEKDKLRAIELDEQIGCPVIALGTQGSKLDEVTSILGFSLDN